MRHITKRIFTRGTWITACLFIVSVLPFTFVTHSLFISSPEVQQDEAVIYDITHSLVTRGVLATNLYSTAVPSLSKYTYTHPPLYFYFLAGWIRVFGDSLETGRMLSVLLGFVSLLLFFILARAIIKNTPLAAAGTFLLSMDSFFSGSARLIRMDMLSFVFVLMGILSYVRVMHTNLPRRLLPAGIFGGLAVLTHPLGLLAPLVILADILTDKLPRKTILNKSLPIILPTLVFLAVWFLSMGNSFIVFTSQFMGMLAYKRINPSMLSLILDYGIVAELVRIGITISSILVGIAAYIRLRDRMTKFLIVSLIITVVVVYSSKEWVYSLYICPFFLLTMLRKLTPPAEVWYRTASMVLLIAYTVVNVLILWVELRQQYPGYAYHDYTRLIRKVLPKQATVLLYSIPDPYFDLRKRTGLTLIEMAHLTPPQEMVRLINESDYVIYDELETSPLSIFPQNIAKYTTIIPTPNGDRLFVIQLIPKTQRIFDNE